jgi:hypothetical protein
MQPPSNNDLIGLDLLVNPKKAGSDSVSLLSGSSNGVKQHHKKKRASSSGSSSVDIQSSLSSGDNKKSGGRKLHSDDDDSSILSDSSSESGTDISSLSSDSDEPRHKMSQEDIMNTKRELLYQFGRMERKGIKVPKKFTLASSLEEMKLEYERIKIDREVEASVRFQRNMLQTVVSGVELMNKKFNPFDIKLDGWSESINESITDYDDIFEELYHKYRGKSKMPPELRLLFSVGGSAVMFHITNSMFKTSLPGLDQVMKNNPDLMRQFAAATMNTMDQNARPQQQESGGGSGVFGMLGSLFGFGGGGHQGVPDMGMPPMHAHSQQSAPRPHMRGPSNMDDILREMNSPQMHADDIDRIEVVSTVTDSELSDIPEDASISGIFPTSSRKPRRAPAKPRAGKTLNI